MASLENKAKPEIEVDSAKNKNVEQIELSFIWEDPYKLLPEKDVLDFTKTSNLC